MLSVEVPEFAYSTYADRRVRKFITEVTEAIDGESISDDDLTVDVLSSLFKEVTRANNLIHIGRQLTRANTTRLIIFVQVV